METFELICHPDFPAQGVQQVHARIVSIDQHWLTLRWRITGTEQLIVPPLGGKRRADGLWQTTCFELFVRQPGQEGYAEFNFSPSERWAAYDFSAYREGMSDRPMARAPVCTMRRGQGLAIFDVAVPRATLPDLPWLYGLTAVVEEQGGHQSFWAIAHAPGKADFHHPACFAAKLAAPQDA